MTVVAFDGRVLAADRMCGTESRSMPVRKIHKLPNGDIVGLAGEMGMITQMLHWLKGDRSPETFPESQRSNDDCIECLIVDQEKHIWVYDRSPYPYRVERDFHAIGSGERYAIAAMALGKSAVKAVELTNTLCPSCGLGVDKIAWKKP